ncbi:MAG TPA: galactokinase [Deinococcales bacterium]|nr:galactokinase [Deinococcales bacterium]
MQSFESLFGTPPEVTASAPGRVNLIGEHTDYNGGFVLPTAIPQRTTVRVSRRPDRKVSAYAAELDERREYELGAEARASSWVDYVAGVTQELARDGVHLGGFNLTVESNVPFGSGLSSSAALLVATIRALRELFAFTLDDVKVATLAQRAENGLVGAHVGIMDQMACSLADQGTALFLDTRSLEYERVPLPSGADLVVLNSGVEHNHAAGDYNTRRAECERAAEQLGVALLRDVPLSDLPRVNALPEPLNRRARHVVTEDERVLEAVQAMRTGDLKRLGELFYASHESMRDDYQISIPEIDLIVDLARARDDIYGARLTGGGFGGSVVMLAHAGRGRQAGQEIADEYARRTGRQPRLLTPAQANPRLAGP